MKRRPPRIYYTEEQKALMWDRWKQGKSLDSTARLFDRHHRDRSRLWDYTGTDGTAQTPRPTGHTC